MYSINNTLGASKILYKLGLFESAQVYGSDTVIIRVPGGWVYQRFWCAEMTSVFIPFNNEYMKLFGSEKQHTRPTQEGFFPKETNMGVNQGEKRRNKEAFLKRVLILTKELDKAETHLEITVISDQINKLYDKHFDK